MEGRGGGLQCTEQDNHGYYGIKRVSCFNTVKGGRAYGTEHGQLLILKLVKNKNFIKRFGLMTFIS